MDGIVCFILCFGISTGSPGTAADSFCRVYERAVRNELRLTDRELAGLRRASKDDLAALKRTYEKRCKK